MGQLLKCEFHIFYSDRPGPDCGIDAKYTGHPGPLHKLLASLNASPSPASPISTNAPAAGTPAVGQYGSSPSTLHHENAGSSQAQHAKSNDTEEAVFQFKFVKNDDFNRITQAVKNELKKINEYKKSEHQNYDHWKNIKHWVLCTNVTINCNNLKKWHAEASRNLPDPRRPFYARCRTRRLRSKAQEVSSLKIS